LTYYIITLTTCLAISTKDNAVVSMTGQYTYIVIGLLLNWDFFCITCTHKVVFRPTC